MEDDFDDFFDSPRQCQVRKTSPKNTYTVDEECTASEDSHCDKNFCKPVGKPPTHPSSRPASAAAKRTLSGRTSPAMFERNLTDEQQAHSSRRVIEAKVPCEVFQQEDEHDSDDSFIAQDDDSCSGGSSGRRSPTPRAVNSNGQVISKEISVPRCDAGSYVADDNPHDLPDYSGSFSDCLTDSDDDSDIIVSPLNTPHNPNVQATSSSSSSVSKRISKSSNNEPVGLLRGDRDSLDLDMLLQTVLYMETQGRSQSRQAQIEPVVSSRGSRRNYSFSNERIQAIDKENQRLMTRIMKHANATKKTKAKVKKLSTSNVGTKRPSSAAINRAIEQQKIEAENSMLLRRLQQTRPTKELRRDVLIGSQSAGQGGSTRPSSAGRVRASSALPGQRPGSGRQARPASACTAVQRYPCTSRPATAVPTRPDDDDVLTWQPDDF